MCPPSGDTDLLAPDAGKGSCYPAYVAASTLTGLAQTTALLGAPLFAWLSARYGGTRATLVAAVTGVVGDTALALCATPRGPTAVVAACLAGLAEMGTIVTSLTLVSAAPATPRASRAAIAGAYSLAGAVGVLLSTRLGGWAFDAFHHRGPFLLLAGTHVAVALLAIPALIRRP